MNFINETQREMSTQEIPCTSTKYNWHITWTMENFGLMMTEIQQRNFQLQENGVLPLMGFIFALNILCNMLLFTEAWNHVLVQWRSV